MAPRDSGFTLFFYGAIVALCGLLIIAWHVSKDFLAPPFWALYDGIVTSFNMLTSGPVLIGISMMVGGAVLMAVGLYLDR